jgi:aryl-phospho-beta-D-glucosidase BglC (GH1 family)
MLAAIALLLQFLLWKVRPDETFVAPTIPITTHPGPASTNFTPPFHTKGRHILDALGNPIKLASINWYGASDSDFVPGGLDVRHRDEIARLILDLGFNSVRLPYADEIVGESAVIGMEVIAANQDLFNGSQEGPLRALDVFHAVVESLTAAGLLVIVNNHITQATWCCGANPCDAGWSNEWFGGQLFCRVPQTEEDWIRNWETVMRPLVQDPLVMGADLRNEVRGFWGTMHWGQWAEAAEKASERLLAMNPNWLMIVEGISSANDLSGVRERPVQLSVPDRVVYSAHVYKWSGWGSLRPFGGRSYEDFAAEMWKNWAYLVAEDTAPVWVGEFGTPDHQSDADRNYWRHLVQFLSWVDVSWGYWALNARKATGEWESYGLVDDDWRPSARSDDRLGDLQRLGLNFEGRE